MPKSNRDDKSQSPAPSGARDDGIDEVIQTKPRSKNHKEEVWNFAQRVKGLPQYAGKPVDELRPIVQRWHEAWGAYLGVEWFDDTWGRFLESWEAIRHPITMEEAVGRATQMPDPDEVMKYPDPKTRLLAKVCSVLQSVHPDKPFHLGYVTAGKIMDMGKDAAKARIMILVNDKLLSRVTRGFTGKDSEYRYNAKASAELLPAPQAGGETSATPTGVTDGRQR